MWYFSFIFPLHSPIALSPFFPSYYPLSILMPCVHGINKDTRTYIYIHVSPMRENTKELMTSSRGIVPVKNSGNWGYRYAICSICVRQDRTLGHRYCSKQSPGWCNPAWKPHSLSTQQHSVSGLVKWRPEHGRDGAVSFLICHLSFSPCPLQGIHSSLVERCLWQKLGSPGSSDTGILQLHSCLKKTFVSVDVNT